MHCNSRRWYRRVITAASLVSAALITTAGSLQSQQPARRDTANVDRTFFTKRDAVLAGIALAGTAVISVFDVRIASYMQSEGVRGGQSRYDMVHSVTFVNEMPLTVGAVVTYGVGRLTHSSTVA